jgi:hypothetical protein
MIHGGHLKDIPKPHRRMSQTPDERRTVIIRITSYRGFSPGATHYYASIHVEDDAIWDTKQNAWVQAWDDEEGRYEFPEDMSHGSKRTKSEKAATAWAKKMIKKHFPADKFDVHIDGMSDECEELLREAARPKGD